MRLPSTLLTLTYALQSLGLSLIILLVHPIFGSFFSSTFLLLASLSLVQAIPVFSISSLGFTISPLEIAVFASVVTSISAAPSVLLIAAGLYLLTFALNLHRKIYQMISSPSLVAHKLSCVALLGLGRFGTMIAVPMAFLGTYRNGKLKVFSLFGIFLGLLLMAAMGGEFAAEKEVAPEKFETPKILAKAVVFFLFSFIDTLCLAKSNSMSLQADLLDSMFLNKAISLILSFGFGALPVSYSLPSAKQSKHTSITHAIAFSLAFLLVVPLTPSALSSSLFKHVLLYVISSVCLTSDVFANFIAIKKISVFQCSLLAGYLACLAVFNNPIAIFISFLLGQLALYAGSVHEESCWVREQLPNGEGMKYSFDGFFETIKLKEHTKRIRNMEHKDIILDVGLAMAKDELFAENYRHFLHKMSMIPHKRITVWGVPSETKMWRGKNSDDLSELTDHSLLFI